MQAAAQGRRPFLKMSDKALPVGWAIKLMTKLPGGGLAVDIFDVTYPDRSTAEEAVKRYLGTGADYEIVAVEELVATDLGPNKVRAR
jgi:hypothetical protein